MRGSSLRPFDGQLLRVQCGSAWQWRVLTQGAIRAAQGQCGGVERCHDVVHHHYGLHEQRYQCTRRDDVHVSTDSVFYRCRATDIDHPSKYGGFREHKQYLQPTDGYLDRSDSVIRDRPDICGCHGDRCIILMPSQRRPNSLSERTCVRTQLRWRSFIRYLVRRRGSSELL